MSSGPEALAAQLPSGRHGLPVPADGLTGSLQGRLTSGGHGIPASVSFEAGPNRGVVLSCDADGQLASTPLYPGLALVTVSAPGAEPCTRELSVRHDVPTPLELDLGPHGMVEGEVVDEQGLPLPGTLVLLDGGEAWTNAEGRFFAPRLGSGAALLEVSRQGFVPHRESLMAVPGLPDDALRRVTLVRGSRITLTLAGVPGGAGDDAVVYVLPVVGQPVAGTPPQPTMPWLRLNPLRVRPGGTHVLEAMPRAMFEVQVVHPFATGHTRANTLLGKDLRVDVVMEPVPRLAGVVTRGDEPVPGATIEIAHADLMKASEGVFEAGRAVYRSQPLEILPSARHTVLSDDQGRFELGDWDHVRGDRYVTVTSPDGEISITRRLDGDPSTLRFDLVRP
jgi:hypothetical protein